MRMWACAAPLGIRVPESGVPTKARFVVGHGEIDERRMCETAALSVAVQQRTKSFINRAAKNRIARKRRSDVGV